MRIITLPNGKGSFEKGKQLRNSKYGVQFFRILDYISAVVKEKIFSKITQKTQKQMICFI